MDDIGGPKKPPDPVSATTKINNYLTLDPNKTLLNTAPGPKYLIMKRKNSNEQTLEKTSPFLLQKVIDHVAGKIESCKKLRNGTIIIKTKDVTQAKKLIQITGIDNQTEVEITEHNSLNNIKGVIYSNDLKYIEDSEILAELKTQYVTEIKRIQKYTDNKQNPIDTGLFILTFNIANLPEYINIGYEKIKTRPYIPQPLKCKNCFHFGHKTDICKKPKICAICNKPYHLNIDKNKDEKCNNAIECTNCLSSEHNSFSKKCPEYIKQKQITEIKITEKTDYKTAKIIYYQRNPTISKLSYASIVKQAEINVEKPKSSIQTTQPKIPKIKKSRKQLKKI